MTSNSTVRQILASVSVLALLAVTAACPQTTAMHKASRAAADISSGLDKMEKLTEQAYTLKGLSADETRAILTGVQSATLANDEFVANVKTLGTVDASNKAQLLTWLAATTASLDKLNQEGVLGISDPRVRNDLTLAFGTIQASVNILANLIAGLK